MRTKNLETGQSLFEVIVSLGIASLILIGIVAMAGGAVRNSSYSRNNSQATKFAQEALEWIREQRDVNWTVFEGYSSPSPGTNTCLGSNPLSSWGGDCLIDTTIFSRQANLTMRTDTDGNSIGIIDVVVTVSWNDAQGAHNVVSQTILTNWKP